MFENRDNFFQDWVKTNENGVKTAEDRGKMIKYRLKMAKNRDNFSQDGTKMIEYHIKTIQDEVKMTQYRVKATGDNVKTFKYLFWLKLL